MTIALIAWPFALYGPHVDTFFNVSEDYVSTCSDIHRDTEEKLRFCITKGVGKIKLAPDQRKDYITKIMSELFLNGSSKTAIYYCTVSLSRGVD